MNELYTDFEINNNLQVVKALWFDGICKLCGGKVYETNFIEDKNIPESIGKDYKNFCITDGCKNNAMHYVYDDEELDYYIHK